MLTPEERRTRERFDRLHYDLKALADSLDKHTQALVDATTKQETRQEQREKPKGPVLFGDGQPQGENTKRNTGNNTNNWNSFNVSSFVIQLLLFFATVAAFSAAFWYARIADHQKNTMVDQWNTMVDQWNTMKSMFAESQSQSKSAALSASGTIAAADAASGALMEARRSREASERQSKSALEASIAASRNDLRAWLGVANIRVVREPIANQDLDLSFDVINSGKTPAVNASFRFHSTFDLVEPHSRDWSDIKPTQSSMIFPNTQSHDMRPTVAAILLTNPIVDAYNARKTAIYIQVRVDYEDVYGCHHWVETCDSHRFGDAAFRQCLGAIGIDKSNVCKR